MRSITCEHRSCQKKDLQAQFTMRISEITKGSPPQPQFYCAKHRGLHPNVSPTGKNMRGGEDAQE